jgi:hypothetical protein
MGFSEKPRFGTLIIVGRLQYFRLHPEKNSSPYRRKAAFEKM